MLVLIGTDIGTDRGHFERLCSVASLEAEMEIERRESQERTMMDAEDLAVCKRIEKEALAQ